MYTRHLKEVQEYIDAIQVETNRRRRKWMLEPRCPMGSTRDHTRPSHHSGSVTVAIAVRRRTEYRRIRSIGGRTMFFSLPLRPPAHMRRAFSLN